MNKQAISKILDLIKRGQYNIAKKNIIELSKTHPNVYSYQNLLAVIHVSQKKYEDAIIILERIIKLSPKFIDAYINLGNIYNELNELSKSFNFFKKAISIDPNHKTAQFNLACILDRQNKFGKSANIYKKLIKKEPNNIDFLTNYSNNQIKSAKLANANKILNIILELDPNNTTAIINLGVIQKEKENFEKATQYFNQALSIRSNISEAYYNLGTVHEKKEEFIEAITSFSKAIKITPSYAEAYYNLGCVLERFGKFNDALISYKKAIKNKSGYTKALHNLARTQLATKNFKNGWIGHELRKDGTKKTFELLGIQEKQIWNGKKFNGSLIVHGEQGIGDEILYSSMFPDLINCQSDLTITTDDRLLRLMKRSFPKVNFISRYNGFLSRKNNSIKHILAGSLGKIFRNSVNDFKKNKRFWLLPCPKKCEEYKKKFSNLKKTRVGLSWLSLGVKNKDRNISLTKLSSIFPKQHFDIINLQYGDTNLDRDMLVKKEGREIIHFNDLDYKNDIESLVAIICNCDLVVSIPNTIAHLSGSLGKCTWVLSPSDSQWYWYSKSKENLWYPNIRLFRQRIRGEWGYVLNLIRKETVLKYIK